MNPTQVSLMKAGPYTGEVHVNRPRTREAVYFMANNDIFKADQICTNIRSMSKSDLIGKSDIEAWRDSSLTPWSGVTQPKTIDHEEETIEFNCQLYAKGKVVNKVVQANHDGWNNQMMIAPRQVAQLMLLMKEKIFANVAFTASNWGTNVLDLAGSGQTQWDGDTDPVRIADAAVDQIGSTNIRGSVIAVAGRKAYRTLKNNEFMLTRMGFSGGVTPENQARVTPSLIAQAFDIDDFIVMNAADNDGYIADNHILFMRSPRALTIDEPTAMAQFTWNRFTGPFGGRVTDGIALFTYPHPERPMYATQVDGIAAFQYLVLASELGYLIQNVGS